MSTWISDFTKLPPNPITVLLLYREIETGRECWGLGIKVDNEIIGRGALEVDWESPFTKSKCGKYSLEGWRFPRNDSQESDPGSMFLCGIYTKQTSQFVFI